MSFWNKSSCLHRHNIFFLKAVIQYKYPKYMVHLAFKLESLLAPVSASEFQRCLSET